MSELNFELLQENIRALLKKNDLTQSELAAIVGMSQGNLSKALNPDEKKQFTLEQLYRISQHFGVSIDELVGNTVPSEITTGPRAVLSFIVKLLCEAKLRVRDITEEEYIYEPYLNEHCGMDCRRLTKEIEYPAFYLANYDRVSDFAFDEHEYDELDMEYCWSGNETKFLKVNEILKNLIPMIKLYREKQIPDDAFQMILNGYLEQLPEK